MFKRELFPNGPSNTILNVAVRETVYLMAKKDTRSIEKK